MNITPETSSTAFKQAIGDAIDACSGRNREYRINAIYDAVKGKLAEMMPAIIEQAMQDPKTITAMAEQVVIPMINEIENLINDDHDAPTTQDLYRPGLRRAARTLRNVRRDIQKETSQ